MATEVTLALTPAGQALKAKIEQGSGTLPLNITRIVTASGQSANPLNLSDIVGYKQEFTITKRVTQGTATTISAVLTNMGLTEGYSIYQIGIYAADPDVGEILYRITQFADPRSVPSEQAGGWTYAPEFTFNTENASEVTVIINPAGLATQAQITALTGDLDTVAGELDIAKNDIVSVENALQDAVLKTDKATIGEAEEGTVIDKWVDPAGVKAAITALGTGGNIAY